jgi:peptidoglycan/xylan/chitin deacetylase (PgdA/CDA1 family)
VLRSMSQPQLHVATYHYVRDLPRTRFPQIKGMLLDDFREQARVLPDLFEMATMSSALEFLNGTYHPRRDLCLMTFDDGLKEHYAEVTPILEDDGIQGVFFLISSCLEDHVVAPVHMNHFLMAGLGFERYRAMFAEVIRAWGFDEQFEIRVDSAVSQHTYPLDTLDVARFKYLFNFALPPNCRDRAVRELFRECIGDENQFARDLYVSWSEAREMQRAGMLLGGHTHEHRPLATLGDEELKRDLARCRELMRKNLDTQDCWPFSYPYGKADSFDNRVIRILGELGFQCSLCTEKGMNVPGTDLFAIRRVDCKEIMSFGRQEANFHARALEKSVSAGRGD